LIVDTLVSYGCGVSINGRRGSNGMGTIKLDSQNHISNTSAVIKDSVLTCSNTSAADVYITGIINNKEEHTLYAGESMAVPKMSTLTVRLFRTNTGTAPFSADLDLSVVPAIASDAKPNVASKAAVSAGRGKSR
jgi:hypothetical protein